VAVAKPVLLLGGNLAQGILHQLLAGARIEFLVLAVITFSLGRNDFHLEGAAFVLEGLLKAGQVAIDVAATVHVLARDEILGNAVSQVNRVGKTIALGLIVAKKV
jgi:hypothetical protein